MKVFPPLSRDEYQRWTKTHPWIAGFYLGLASGEVVAIITFLDSHSESEALTWGVSVGVVMWLLNALSIKRGWFERSAPAPSEAPVRRHYSRVSDRGLRWGIGWGAVAVISFGYSLLAGKGNVWVSFVLLGVMLPMTFLPWRELRRRKREGG